MLLCVNVRKGGVRLFYAFSQASENRPEEGEREVKARPGETTHFLKAGGNNKERGGEKEERRTEK